MVEFRYKTEQELAAWLPPMMADYLKERIAAGEESEVAAAHVAAQTEQLFPGNAPAEGHHVMNIVDGEIVIGTMWLGRPALEARDTWFVFDVQVNEEARGRGYGRAAMEAAERWTFQHGGTRIALNVFGPNVVARSLYDSLGYRVTTTAMYKDLASGNYQDATTLDGTSDR